MESKVIQISKACNRIEPFNALNLTIHEQDTAISLAISILKDRYKPGRSLEAPASVRKFLQLQYAKTEFEVFSGIFLDQKNRIICFEELSRGTIDTVSIYCREVVKAALKHNAVAVIFSHNHPSGDPEPSEADKRIAKRLKKSLALVDIRVLDHLVVGTEGSVSLAERSYL